MAGDVLNYLNKDDLFLLMESYRNMIEMHSTLAEQQKQIIELQNKIMTKQEGITLSQTRSHDHFDRIAEKLNECISTLKKTNETIAASCSSLENKVSNEVGVVNDKVGNYELESTKQHSSISTKIYVAMGGMATIIIGLITLVITILGKFNSIDEINKILNQILSLLQAGG